MTTIPSLYNFVPLSDLVFHPPWAPLVFQDVPFSDGVMGSLQVRVTAETPIYIRNDGDRNSPEHRRFFQVQPGGDFAVNGTSFKGMLRNILEIASFGKLCREEDHRYSFRDLRNDKYTGRMTDKKPFPGGGFVFTPKSRAGWLREDAAGRWTIEPCDFARVEIAALQAYHGNCPDLDDVQDAVSKYHRWAPESLAVDFTAGAPGPHPHSPGRLFYQLVDGSSLAPGGRGQIVFTGQPNHRKHMEFIFYPRAGARGWITSLISKEVPEPVRDEFIRLHGDAAGKPLPAWQYWRSRLGAGGGVPVFYLQEHGRVDALGLAMMFRLPYKYGIGELIDRISPAHRRPFPLDLAETMFGRIGDDDANLRGRVAVEPLLLCDGPGGELAEVTTILGQPRPSYYPNYLEQEAGPDGRVARYKTYEDDDAVVRGWKRYPVRPAGREPQPAPPPRRRDGGLNREAATSFVPLPAGSVFRGPIHVHNLRMVELGALVWVLTWGGDQTKRHNLGMAKPYGYGTVRVEILAEETRLRTMDGTLLTIEEIWSCWDDFAGLMEDCFRAAGRSGWLESEQLVELLAMADPAGMWPDDDRRYPVLRPGSNEFDRYKSKNERRRLKRHSESHRQ